MMSVSLEFNPYEPLQETSISADLSPLESWRQVLLKFRRESDALAGVAFFLAISSGLLGYLVSSPEIPDLSSVFPLIGSAVALVFSLVGVQISLKKMIGVRILLFFHYVCLLLTLLLFAVAGAFSFVLVAPAAIVLGLTAAQCHRVLRNAKRLISVGIPLNTRPHELETEHFRQLFDHSRGGIETDGPLTPAVRDQIV